MSNKQSQLLTHIVSIFDAMPLVNTIVFKDDDVIDVEKEINWKEITKYNGW